MQKLHLVRRDVGPVLRHCAGTGTRLTELLAHKGELQARSGGRVVGIRHGEALLPLRQNPWTGFGRGGTDLAGHEELHSDTTLAA